MKRIYSESDVCISTAAAASATRSCFRERNVRFIEPAAVTLYGEPHLLFDPDHSLRGFRNAPIASRAWCFQERLLSRRILTYGQHEIHWECLESEEQDVCETFPAGIEAGNGRPRGPFSLPSIPVDTSEDPKLCQDTYGRAYQDWIKLIELYCECQLRQADSDKFAAFSGIAEHMQNVFTKSPYIAGFFAFELPTSLLWHVCHSTRPNYRPKQDRHVYRAPTWSWAAADTPVKCYNLKFTGISDLIRHYAFLTDHTVRLMDPDNSFSQLLWAEISLRAPLLSLRWQKHRHSDGRKGTLYRLAEFECFDSHPCFHFDSVEDYEANQEGVSFLPIHGDHCVMSGLIVRLVSYDPQNNRPTREEGWEDCEPTWRRIGMANTYDETISDYVKSAPKQRILLI